MKHFVGGISGPYLRGTLSIFGRNLALKKSWAHASVASLSGVRTSLPGLFSAGTCTCSISLSVGFVTLLPFELSPAAFSALEY